MALIWLLPLAFVALGERGSWPRRLRWLRVAHYAELGIPGGVTVVTTAATIVEVLDELERPTSSSRPSTVLVNGSDSVWDWNRLTRAASGTNNPLATA
jgi:hypothetical protein